MFQFEGILKPAYNRVDMAEVELTDDDLDPREYNRTLIEVCFFFFLIIYLYYNS